MKLRNALFVAAVLLNLSILTSCSTTDPEPEIPLADQIEGEYVGDSYTAGTKLITLPATNSDGVIATVRVIINKLSDSEADFIIVFKQSKAGIENSSRSQSDTIQLSKNASGDIVGTESHGYSLKYTNDTVVLDIPNADPSQSLSITASK
ncbi:hypothetical protein [Arcticibacterium luteifluviistationis]|uniref:Lipocalin-like domain-containing protein n=1 Tax=Arcticibacterium luteifluviistationis TaxID=1784714 RepID=A0A2Z4GGZ2_9BACT|nr:hypothetical protein [Arcticibacterium luteifluviistationis]AWW00462.1 hypothetical protein DJ013_20685 [Arcticibacterium luteifluviistationis]